MALAGKRILVVEDEALLAMRLEELLRDHGCQVVGPVARLGKAQALLEHEPIDAAVLDINLAGSFVFPLALALRARRIPFVFATAYADGVRYPPEVQGVARIAKPYSDAQIVTALERALAVPPD